MRFLKGIDWARAQAGAGAAALVPLALMTVAGFLEPGTSRAFGLAGLPALALLAVLLRHRRALFTSALGAGLAAGWALGAGIRVAMLIAALMGGGAERSVTGTLGLVLFAAIPGVLLSGVLMCLRAVRDLGPRGAAVLLSLVCAQLLASSTREELFARGNGWVNTVTFMLSAAAAGWVLGAGQRAIEGWWAARARRPGAAAVATA